MGQNCPCLRTTGLGQIGASENSEEARLSVRTRLKVVSHDEKKKKITNRFQSWNQQDLESKCRGKGRIRDNS